jgi:excisionase family DNA binding protein
VVSLIRRRKRQNTYRNTYVDDENVRVLRANRRFLIRKLIVALDTFQSYDVIAVLKRDISGADTPQYRSNAIPYCFVRAYDLFWKMRSNLETHKLLYSVAEVAQLLSLSRGTVYKLIETGRLLAVFPTSHARVSADSLHRYVALLETEQRQLTHQLTQVLA